MDFPRRKATRLSQYDYSSSGAYFVTVCTQERKCILSHIVGDGSPVPKPLGKIAEEYIRKIPEKYPHVRVDKYIIMPNHIHMILFFDVPGGTGDPSPTLGNVLGWYKYNVTRQFNEENAIAGMKLFQRSFHDHVIRGEEDYLKIWEYIDGNGAKWADDCYYSGEGDA